MSLPYILCCSSVVSLLFLRSAKANSVGTHHLQIHRTHINPWSNEIKWNQMNAHGTAMCIIVHIIGIVWHCDLPRSTALRTSLHSKAPTKREDPPSHGVMGSWQVHAFCDTMWHQTTNKDGVRKRIPIHPYHLGERPCCIFVAYL